MSDDQTPSEGLRRVEFWVLVALGSYLLVFLALLGGGDIWFSVLVLGSYAMPLPWFMAARSAKSTGARVVLGLLAAGHAFWALTLWSWMSGLG